MVLYGTEQYTNGIYIYISHINGNNDIFMVIIYGLF